MPTITDTTGVQSFEDVAGLVWIKTTFPSYVNYRTPGFFIGQSPKGFWWLYTDGSNRAQVFSTARAAQLAAAERTVVVAA